MLPAPRLSELTGADVHVKYENLQVTNSFKDRGAFVKLASLSETERERGVIAMSAGNHAQAVAYHARRLGIGATIVMPETTPFVKVEATRAHGAEVVLKGEGVSEAHARAQAIARERGLTFVHPYDDEQIIAGQGTIALEMLEEVPELDVLVVPIGGGGLIAGNAIAARAARPALTAIGVEAALYPSMHNVLKRETGRSAARPWPNGIAVKNVGTLTLPIVREFVSDIVLVDEAHLERAVNLYLTLQKTMAEGAGAAGLAAMLAEPARFQGRKVGLILCGGNIDPRILASIMVRELERSDRSCHPPDHRRPAGRVRADRHAARPPGRQHPGDRAPPAVSRCPGQGGAARCDGRGPRSPARRRDLRRASRGRLSASADRDRDDHGVTDGAASMSLRA